MPAAKLPFHLKLIYGLGDHSINVALVSLTMIFPFYLTDVVEMPMVLAGLVPLVGRSVDAVSDVFMGRLSDRTQWKAGRRRPYLLIGALPFAIFFALIWAVPPFEDSLLLFAYFSGIYSLISISMTIVAIPYQALMPDLTDDYDERTALATSRSVLSLIGTLVVAVAFRPTVAALGGDPPAWAMAGSFFALWILWPWLPIWWVTWEKPRRSTETELQLRDYVAVLVGNRNYRTLLGFFALGRIAIDLPLALFLIYFKYVIGNESYFDSAIFGFILGSVIAMPVWQRFARGRDKSDIYIYSCGGWIVTFCGMLLMQPDWPQWTIVLVSFLSGCGYAAADMMPWSMVADIADEDELASGERREGLFVGVFTFIRKMAGALGVAFAFFVLDRVGFVPNVENSDNVLMAIRIMTAGVPILVIVVSVFFARNYTLGHEEHREVLAELDRRKSARASA